MSHHLSLAAPLRSFIGLATVDDVPLPLSAVARVRGFERATVYSALATDDGISVASLAAYVAAFGAELELRVRLPEDFDEIVVKARKTA